MKRIVLVLALILAGCQGGPSPAQLVTTGCQSYASLLFSLAGFRQAGKLTPSQVAAVDQTRQVVNPICSSPTPPTDANMALAQIQGAIDQFASIQAGVK